MYALYIAFGFLSRADTGEKEAACLRDCPFSPAPNFSRSQPSGTISIEIVEASCLVVPEWQGRNPFSISL